MNKKLWAGRFQKQVHPMVERYTASIDFDYTLIYEDILGSLVHVNMLEKCSLIDKEESNQLQLGLKKIVQEYDQGKIEFHLADEDIHTNIERYLKKYVCDLADKLHTARSRNDQVALDTHLYLRKQIIFIVHLLIELQNALLDLATKHQNIVFPAYTHLQRAQPIYLAQHWLAYVAMLHRDVERLQSCWIRVNQSPSGACAVAGSTLATDQYYVAAELGLEGVYLNTLDAVSDRDFIVEFLAAASLIMMHISRLSEELIIWSSQEFNFISFDDAYCTGSSMMPQKKNPDVAELSRGKTGRVYGALVTILTLLKGLPLAYNKDLQEDKEPLFDVVKTLTHTVSIYIPLLATLKVNSDVIHHSLQSGYLNATALAEYLVTKGISFREAHSITGKMVAYCLQNNSRLQDLTLADMQGFSMFIGDDVYSALAIEKIASITQSKLLTLSAYENQISISKAWLAEKLCMLQNIYLKFDVPLK